MHIKKLYTNFSFHKAILGASTFSSIITIPIGSADALIAWFLKPYMDVVMIEKNISQTWYIPFLIIIFSLIQSFLSYLATYLNTWVGRKISNDVKADLFNKLMFFDCSYFDKTSSGNILLRFNSDVDTACNGLLNNLKLFTTRFFSSISLIVAHRLSTIKNADKIIIINNGEIVEMGTHHELILKENGIYSALYKIN